MTLNSFIAIIMLVFIVALAISTAMVSVVIIKEMKKIRAEKQSAANISKAEQNEGEEGIR